MSRRMYEIARRKAQLNGAVVKVSRTYRVLWAGRMHQIDISVIH